MPTTLDVLINEIYASHSGTDNSEFIELFGTPGTSLDGWSLIVVEGDEGSSTGSIDQRFDFGADDMIGTNGYFLMGNPDGLVANFGVTPNYEFSSNTLENSSFTVALVETSTISGTSVAGGENVADALALMDSGANDVAFFGAPQIGPDGSFFPAGAQRLVDGANTGSAADWAFTSFYPGTNQTPTAGTGDPVINEFVVDHTGSDTNEYIEVLAAPNADLSNYTLVEIEGDGSRAGTIDEVIHLGTADAAGYWWTGYQNNRFENGTSTLMLVEDFTGAVGDDIDIDNDGVIDAAAWGRVVDSVATNDGGSSDQTYSETVLAPNYDGNRFQPGGASRIPDGQDSDSNADWIRNDYFQVGTAASSPNIGEAVNTPGAANAQAGDPGAPIAVKIHDIQGDGDASDLQGTAVQVTAVVTVVAPALRGFFIQEEDVDQDGNAATSEGIFVYTGTRDTGLVAGDLVELSGIVSEFRGTTQIAGDPEWSVISTGNSVTAATVQLPVSDLGLFETVEGMLVEVTGADGEPLVVTDTYDRFGEVGVTSGEVLYQPTQVYESFSAEAAALAELNSRDFLLFENAFDDSLSAAPRAGDGIVGDMIVGAMHYSFGDYKVEAAEAVSFDKTDNPRPDSPPDVGGEFQVASFNVLNLFTTLDGQTANGSNPRGASNAEDLANQTAKIVSAIIEMEAEVIGLVEIENDFLAGSSGNAVEYLVGEINAELGEDVWAWVEPDTQFVGTDAIANAIIYDTRVASVSGSLAVLDDESFTAPYTPGDPKNRAAIAQTFEEIETGETFTVSVNHFKSKGSTTGAIVDGEPDDSPIEGSAALTRVKAALELAAWLESDPTGSGDDDVLILGDLNAYAMERAILALIEEGYTNLAGADASSYGFDGRYGTLDYAMANDALLSQVDGAGVWEINSAEAYSIQYNGSNFDTFGDLGPFASSDHDPLLLGLTLRNEIFGTDGKDKIEGTDSRDVIYAMGGKDKVSGGEQADIFVFGDIVGEKDKLKIVDFDVTEDTLDIGSAQIVDINESGNHVRLTLAGDKDTIMLKGVDDFDMVNIISDEMVFV